MRERHFPRLCRTCDAPMARQERSCWSCGSAWQADPQPAGAASAREIRVRARRRAPAHRTNADHRWADDGGRIFAEPVLAGT
jgi:hypothetical protein